MEVLFIAFCLINLVNGYNYTSIIATGGDGDLLVPDILRIAEALEEATQGRCREDFRAYLEGFAKQERWAMNMFDSSVKFPQGILAGNSYQLGNFDQCLSDDFGQYCLIQISSNSFAKETQYKRMFSKNGSSVHWAICVPSSCSPEEIRVLFEDVFQRFFGESALAVTVPPSLCSKNQRKPITYLEIIYSSIICLFVTFVLGTTLYHVVHIRKKSKRSEYALDRSRKTDPLHQQILISFSLIRNASKILAVRSTNNELNLDCICGVRVISMVMILSGHCLIFRITSPIVNADFYENELGKPQNAIFLNNPLLVDTFLLLSGFLFCRLLLQELEKKKGGVNVFFLYIARYVRLTPAYCVVLGFYCTFLLRLGDGPLWQQKVGVEQERCLNSWWTNLLYLNNYLQTDQQCMFQSWYLSVDTQLFVFVPIVIYSLWKWTLLGPLLLALTLMVTAILPWLITFFRQLDPTLMIYLNEIQDLTNNHYFKTAYIKTEMRAISYVIGMVFGYAIYRLQGFRIPNYVIIFGNVIALLCGFASLFSIILFYSPAYEYNVWISAIYAPLHRLGWCFAMGWIVFVCVLDKAESFLGKFLSSKIFAPLSKLTYCAYLVNGIVEIYSAGSIRVPIYLSIFNLSVDVVGHVIITFAIAFVICLLFESPIHNLEKILIKRYTSEPKIINEET